MSVNIIQYPQRNVNDNNQFVSKWSAVHHEMTFKMQRKDYTGTYGVNPSDNTQMYISPRLAPGIIQVVNIGDVVYIESDNGDSEDFVVVGIGAGGVFYVDINNNFNPNGGNCFVNLYTRKNYYIKTKIYVVNEFNQYVLAGESINKPNASGLAEVDVSSFLKAHIDYLNDFDYSLLNDKDLSLGGAYNIVYSENWEGVEGSFSGISETELRFFVNSAKQIQDVYGQNMGEYVPFYFETPSASYPESKFLSDFESPTYFPGFPFSLGFIYSEYLIGIETNKLEEQFDVNDNSVASASSLKLENVKAQNVNRLTVEGSYPTTTKSIEVWLETDGVEDCVEFVTPGYVQVGYMESICGLPNVSLPLN